VEKEGNLHTIDSMSQRGAIGIGAMIIFIAMVLIAGIAAYIIISTGSQLEMKSSSSGQQTITEVSTGLKISTIEAHNSSGVIDKVVIVVTPRSGSPDIALTSTLIELSNQNEKYILNYSSASWVNGTTGVANIFQANAFPASGSEFGLIVLKDEDHSCQQNTPVLSRDDSVMLTLNTSAVFGGISENVKIQGNVIPEEGSWGVIQFTTPSAFAQEVLILQEG
jgi:flagellin FlaB